MSCWSIYFYKVHYKKLSPLEGFFTVRDMSFGSGRGNHTKGALHQDKRSTPNAPNLREGCRHSSSCWVRLSMPSVKHHLTIANANTAKRYTHCLIVKCGARSEHIWLHLLPPKGASPGWITLHKGSSHTRRSAHMQQPEHWVQTMYG